jgi:hypothetical protein|tara:strand:- start:8380 stop:8628 length:249 start_codon:yes stop_codon:yes gene_type:complete
MTPQEINEYKQRWLASGTYYPVRLHSDLDTQGKTWCRRNLERHQWKMDTWTHVYEHTFIFEYKHDADEFSKQWPKFINQERI